jgi:hypothetical protein
MKNFELSIGLYPGILIGIRSYPEKTSTMHVLYLPFLDFCLEVFHDEE